MLDEKKGTLRSRIPSLLPLRMVLSAAERESPPRPLIDANEQLALQLIEKMQVGYKKPPPFLNWKDVPSTDDFRESRNEMMVAHA